MKLKRIGVDLAKQVFQAHGADGSGAVVFRKTLRRHKVLAFFAAQPPCLVAMEACGSAHQQQAGFGETAVEEIGDGHATVAVIGDDRRIVEFRLVRRRVDQHVGALRRAEPVEIDGVIFVERLKGFALLGLGKARIEKAAAVLGPGEPGRAALSRPLASQEAAVAATVDDLQWVEFAADGADDAPLQGWLLRVTGKGQKLREVPVPADVAAYMARVCALPGVKAWIDEALAEQDFIDFEEPFRLYR